MPQEHSPEPRENIGRFEKLLAALIASGVDFAVVGGLAVIFNGYSRFTIDLDILVHDSEANLKKLLSCLENWGEGWARELKPSDFQIDAGCIRVAEDFDLDIFTRMKDRKLHDFRPRLRYVETANIRIPYISPSDLVYLKEGSWRDKDKLDVKAMREIIEREGGKK